LRSTRDLHLRWVSLRSTHPTSQGAINARLKIGIASVPASQTSYTLHCYNITPPSAQADNDAWILAAGDLAAYLGPIDLGTPVDIGGALYVRKEVEVGKSDFQLITPSIFTRLVTEGAHTAAAVARTVTMNVMAI
jgi:hypothetical protein